MPGTERNKNVVIAGGSGLIGRSLTRALLDKGYNPIVLTRGNSKKSVFSYISYSDPNCEAAISSSFAVINLAGQNLASGIWTKNYKKKIFQSRIEVSNLVTKLILQAETKPEVYIQASAIGFYGNEENITLTEANQKGNGFLSDVCYEWEKAALSATYPETRFIITRFGIVLSPEAGFLKKQMTAIKFLPAFYFGEGRQWLSWIHIDDLTNAIVFLIEQKNTSGIYNLVSPNPLTAMNFASVLKKVYNKISILAIPGILTKLFLGTMGKEILLSGQITIPEKLVNSRFNFQYPDLNSALQNFKENKKNQTKHVKSKNL